MTVVALSVTYRTAPLPDLERVAVPSAVVGEGLARVLAAREVAEAALLCTCNRSEVYLWAGDPDVAAGDVRAVLEDFRGVPRGWLVPRSEVLVGDAAVRHLFLVTAGLDSMVPGEAQIQGQVREAYRFAHASRALGPNLHALFRGALEAGKKARAASTLDEVRRSIPRAGVEALAAALDGLGGRHVVVVGTGKMATASVEALDAAGATIQVAARRPEAAPAPEAGERSCPAVPIEELDHALGITDAVIFATTAPHVLLHRERAEEVIAARGGRPLVVLDLGMPHNVDPEATTVPGVTVFDLGRLHRDGYTSGRGWETELERVREIVLSESVSCTTRLRARAADDFGARIHALAEEVAAAEVARVFRKVPGLDHDGREVVSVAVARAVRKLLHAPTVRGREAAARGDDQVLAVARWLFALDDEGAPGDRIESEAAG